MYLCHGHLKMNIKYFISGKLNENLVGQLSLAYIQLSNMQLLFTDAFWQPVHLRFQLKSLSRPEVPLMSKFTWFYVVEYIAC